MPTITGPTTRSMSRCGSELSAHSSSANEKDDTLVQQEQQIVHDTNDSSARAPDSFQQPQQEDLKDLLKSFKEVLQGLQATLSQRTTTSAARATEASGPFHEVMEDHHRDPNRILKTTNQVPTRAASVDHNQIGISCETQSSGQSTPADHYQDVLSERNQTRGISGSRQASPHTLKNLSRLLTEDHIQECNDTPQWNHVVPPNPSSILNTDKNLGLDSQRQIYQSNMLTIPINQVNPPNFNGDKTRARSWLINYEDIMNVNGYTQDQMLKRARAYLQDEGLQWFNTTMYLMSNPSWQDFKTAFYKHFCGIDGTAALRKKLAEARQKHNEHPSSFFVRTVDLCLQYNPRMKQEELVERIAQGLTTSSYNSLATNRDRSTWTVDWLRRTFEQLKAVTEPVSRHTGSDEKGHKTSRQLTPPKVRNLATWICFNCDQKGHEIEACPQPRDNARIKTKTDLFRAERLKSRQNGDKARAERSVNNLDDAQPRPTTTALACDNIPKPYLTLKVNGSEITGRIDTGADLTVLPSHVANELNLQLMPWDQQPLRALGTTPVVPTGIVSVLVDHEHSKRALLVAILPDSVLSQPLWGNDLLEALSIKLCYTPTHSMTPKTIANIATKPHPVDKVEFGDIPLEHRKVLEHVLIEAADVFSKDESDIGRTSTIKHRIHLSDDKPVFSAPYRTPVRNRDAMDETIKKMLGTGAIRPSKSPYASPVFFVDKDHGTAKRLVADFRALNSRTIPDRTPMPHPEDVFGMLAGTTIFAKLDITAMFNQIEVDERDIPKTAITTPLGLYECPLMPFGLINAPATAVRLMKEVLRDLDSRTCFVYFDDIIVFAKDINELVQRCTEVLSRLRRHGLKLKPSKCSFAVESVKFLGHIVSSKGVEMDKRRIEDVLKFPVPRNPSDVRSFYGLCSYNRKFIRNFANIAKPLTPLMGRPSDFTWSTEAQSSFEQLKTALTETPVLVHFNPEAQHELRTDASSYAIGAVLYQKSNESNQTGVVLYYSKSLTTTQQSYSATERELLAAFSAITDLKHYLIGKRFTLVTDHAALTSLKNHKDPHHRLARWVAQLQCYEFDVQYKSGPLHKDADCMSRLAPYQALDDNVADERLIRAICHVTNTQTATQTFEAALTYDVRNEQRSDELCNKYIQILESESSSEEEKARKARNFTLQNGQLYRKISDNALTLVIPERRRTAILLSAHDTPIGGHLGFTRTYRLIKSRFYWPKMRRDIKRYVSSCLGCQRRKAPNTRKQGFTRSLPIAEQVFDTVGIDLMTKLPATYAGYKALLVCTDNLSKYVVAVPLRNEVAETILHAFFNHVVAIHGCPRVVISDNGSNLVGEASRDFFRLFGIKRIHTSVYHPQSNGQTERFNRTLAASLTNFVDTNQKNWSDYIQALTFAYNVSEHSVTKVSPYEYVFGRMPRLPIDNIMERSEFIDPTRPAPGILSSEAINNMKKLITKNQLANKKRLDARLARCTFKVGDMVLVERPTRVEGAAGKLTYTYIGPYKIRRKNNDLSFEIANLRGKSGVSVVHPCHLKKFIPRTEFASDDLVDPKFIPREALTLEDSSQAMDEQPQTDTCPTPQIPEDVELTYDPPPLSPHYEPDEMLHALCDVALAQPAL